MSDQWLNLLPQRFRKVHIPFDFYKILGVVSVSVLGLSAIVIVLVIINYQLVQELEIAEKKRDSATQEMEDFKANNSKKILDETITVRISKYEKMLRQRQAFLKKINNENFGNTRGFSEYLLALSRKKEPSIWIQEFTIQDDAKAFGIKGRAVSPLDITAYLQRLQVEPAMNGIVFDDLNLTRESHPKGDFVLFSLSYGTFSGGVGFGTNSTKVLAQMNIPMIER